MPRNQPPGGLDAVPLIDDSSTLASGAVASEFGPSLHTLAPDDTRVRRPSAYRRPQPRTKAGAHRRPGSNVLSVAERTPPPPGRPPVDARPVRRRRGATSRRNAIRLFEIGARAEGAMVVLNQPPRARSNPARRPDPLALRIARAGTSSSDSSRRPAGSDRAARRPRARGRWVSIPCRRRRPSERPTASLARALIAKSA